VRAVFEQVQRGPGIWLTSALVQPWIPPPTKVARGHEPAWDLCRTWF